MHPGTSDELLQRLSTGQVNDTIPVMLLAVHPSPDFPREYEGKYVGVTGNMFSTHSLDRAVRLW
jgi:hypothetical protein